MAIFNSYVSLSEGSVKGFYMFVENPLWTSMNSVFLSDQLSGEATGLSHLSPGILYITESLASKAISGLKMRY